MFSTCSDMPPDTIPHPTSGARIPPRASIQFLAEAFAAWCDQKSRLSAARATGLLDEESHAALLETYTRTRELIGALLSRAEARRAEALTGGSAASIDGEAPAASPGRSCSTC